MMNHAGRILTIAAGALFALSGIAMGQDSTNQTPNTQPPHGSMQDTASVQSGVRDTSRGLQGTSQTGSRDSVQGSAGESTAPDNTGINKRDRNAGEATADEQGQSAADIDMTRKIRRAIIDDDSLSSYAKNIKIITKDGMVTLKGPVRSEQEKSVIEAKAAAVAGQDKIKDEIEVKAATQKKND